MEKLKPITTHKSVFKNTLKTCYNRLKPVKLDKMSKKDS